MQQSEVIEAKSRVKNSRERNHLLKEAEMKTLQYLCGKMPSWVTSDLLTLTGIIGALVIYLGLVLAISNKYFLLISVAGFALHWFGDSLDGRLAYYRNIPRKWYGWSLDINADWISICVIGLGFYNYFQDFKVIAFLFVVAYGGSMILTLMQYKINNQYVIDKGSLGPTELRIIISLVLLVEIYVPNALLVFATIATLAMLYLNAKESHQLMKIGDIRDHQEKQLVNHPK